MARKCWMIEMGMGIDQHGQEQTVAVARAYKMRSCHYALPGIWEVALLERPCSNDC